MAQTRVTQPIKQTAVKKAATSIIKPDTNTREATKGPAEMEVDELGIEIERVAESPTIERSAQAPKSQKRQKKRLRRKPRAPLSTTKVGPAERQEPTSAIQTAERQLIEALSAAPEGELWPQPPAVGNVETDNGEEKQRELENWQRGVTVAKATTIIGKRITPTLFDTGASPSVLKLDAWLEIKRQNPHILWQPLDSDTSLRMPNGTRLPTMGQVTLPITVLGRTHCINVFVT